MALGERSDVDLLCAAGSGDGPAFAAFYDRHAEAVFGYCRRILDDEHDAADAAHEAFLGLLTREHQAPGTIAEPSAYLFRTARNAALRTVSRQRRLQPVERLPEGAAVAVLPEGEQHVLTEDLQATVRAANERLPVRQREVLALREIEGLSYEEIGERMELSPNAAAQLAWRARGRFRRLVRHGALGGIAAATAECQRAMTLTTLAEDGPLREDEAVWLERHLEECDRCRASRAVMAEIGSTYRVWAPGLALVAASRGDVLAEAGQVVGADWSSVAAGGSAAKTSARSAHGHGAGVATGVVTAVMAAVAAGFVLTSGEDEPESPPRAPGAPAQGPAASSAPRSTSRTAPAARPAPRRRTRARPSRAVAARAASVPDAPPVAMPVRRVEPAPEPPTVRPPEEPARTPPAPKAPPVEQPAPTAEAPPPDGPPPPARAPAATATAPLGPPGIGVGGTPPGHGGPRPGIGVGGTPPGHQPVPSGRP
jgi:RNA polymerase sigma factor (sigma-70 family)